MNLPKLNGLPMTNKRWSAFFLVMFFVFMFIFFKNRYTMNIIMAIIMLQFSLSFKTWSLIRGEE